MIKRLFLVVLLLVVMFGGIFGWKFYSGQKMAAMMSRPPPPVTVASAEVELQDWQPYLRAVGSVAAVRGVFVTTEVPGQVSAILFKSGRKVEAGEVILQLVDTVDKADLDGLIAQQTLARLQFERNRK
ncbi:MAG TPA: efflux transporter periplasmic adaptor subunit, partial [Gammaproteobacteria bacterium]|nr:efflux transporter periplasmic adaptor subunit [Gammaproteobacteria bacterium]